MFESANDSELLDVMGDAQRAERVAVARKVVAAGRFTLQRLAASGQDFLQWCVDYWDVVAAEIAAELGISRGLVLIDDGLLQTLIERLPTLGEVFTAGAVDFRVIRIVAFRTALIRDEQALAAIDEMVAHKAPAWNALSDKKLADLLDWMVLDVDPDAWRVAQQADEDRHLEFGRAKDGTVEVYGSLRITDAAALNAQTRRVSGHGVPRRSAHHTGNAAPTAIEAAVLGRGIGHGLPMRIRTLPRRHQCRCPVECGDSCGGRGGHRRRRGHHAGDMSPVTG